MQNLYLAHSVRQRPNRLLQVVSKPSRDCLVRLLKTHRQIRMLVILLAPRKSGTVVPLCDFLRCNTLTPVDKGIPP